MLTPASPHTGPAPGRNPRGGGMQVGPETAMSALPIGKGEIRRSGHRIALLVFGSLLFNALQAAEQLDATVANMRFVKPLDVTLIEELAARHDLLVTLEENAVIGGAGSEVARVLESLPNRPRLLRLGLPDTFIDHGDQAQLLELVGLDAPGIAAAIKRTYPDNS